MKLENTAGRVGYIFLCLFPLLAMPAAGIRGLRVSGVYQTIGVVLFAAVAVAAWISGLRALLSEAETKRMLALSGGLFLLPFALVSLLWVGLGTPWEATAAENQMRYLVLLFSSVAVTTAFVVLSEILKDAGERFFSTPGFAFGLLGGAAYVVWMSFELGAAVIKARDGQVSPAIVAMGEVFDILLFAACVLTYLATAAFAAAFGRARWLSRAAANAYLAISFIALIFLFLRGLSFPDPNAAVSPWYTSPGFIVGIPAIPWLMPFFFGIVLLRRAARKDEIDGN